MSSIDRRDASRTDAARAASAIAAYAPVSLCAEARVFVREVVAVAAPETPARAKALLFAASRLACFGESAGLELNAEVLFAASTIERFIVTSERTISPATRRTLRTNLRALARSLERYPEPAPTPLPRESAKRRYSGTEIEGYLRLAACQSTPARRMRAGALICLGAGAGVIASELRHLRGSDNGSSGCCRSGCAPASFGSARCCSG